MSPNLGVGEVQFFEPTVHHLPNVGVQIGLLADKLLDRR